MPQHKLLVIGLDGATFDLLEPWAAAGLLPTFDRLLKSGAKGWLRSVPNTDTAPAWATFATGLNPAKHGLFHELGWSPDQLLLRPVTGADRKGTSFWRIASDAGCHVCLLNVPFTYPAEPINGILLAGIDAPSPEAPGFCHPIDFVRDLRRTVGPYRIESGIQAAIKEDQPAEGLADAFAVAQYRTRAFSYALSRGHWDLGVIVYSMPDVVQHFFWQQMCKDAGPQRSAIRDSYRLIDQQIKDLMSHTDENTNILIVSDHGFGPICATREHLATWLIENGFAHTLSSAQQPWQQRLVRRSYEWLRNRLGEKHKAALRRGLPALRNRVESQVGFADIDWRSTVAYAGPSPFEVWINFQGREPGGIVLPGSHYEQIRKDLIAALLDWRNPQNGERRVRQVYRREKVYDGPYLEWAPDLTIEWNPAAAPPPETLEGNASRFDADHQLEGVLLATGPGIHAGAQARDATLADIAPTVLRLLNITYRQPMDGRVLSELLAPSVGGTG